MEILQALPNTDPKLGEIVATYKHIREVYTRIIAVARPLRQQEIASDSTTGFTMEFSWEEAALTAWY